MGKSIHKVLPNIEAVFEQYGLLFSLLFALLSSVLYATLSVIRHMHFQSGAFDLGIFDQAVWQYAHFLYPFSTIKEKFILGDHLNLTMPILAPLYWVWNDVRILLIFQSVWVSFSSVGIFLFLKKRLQNSLQAFLLSITYLLFYGIQFGLYFDFHPILLAVGIMAWMLYFWEEGKWKFFWVSTTLLLLTQENAGIGLLGMCCIWFFEKKRIKLVVLLGLLGLVATTLSFYTIRLLSYDHLQYVPHFAPILQGILYSFYDAQEKQQVWFYTYVSYAFLPLLSIGSVFAVVGDISQYFITGSAFNHMWSPFLHHRAILVIFLIAGLTDVLLFIKSNWRKIVTPLVIFLFLWCVGVTYHYHFAITKLFHREFWKKEQWVVDNEAVIQKIPQGASLAAQQSLVPHVAHREEIYLVYPRQRDFSTNSPCGQKTCWWLDFAGKPQYLFVDTHPGEWATMTLESIDNFSQGVKDMENAGVITLVTRQSETRLYRVNSAKLQQIKL